MIRLLSTRRFARAALLLAAISPGVRADQWNKKTIVDIANPVEVPGAVLQPGRYVFKLVDSASDRNIVRVTNEREDHVYTTILALPNYRMQPTDNTVLTFYEMPSGNPEALRAWFYPGDNFGQEFTYPKDRATQIAQVTRQEVPEELPASPEPKASPPTPASAAPAPGESIPSPTEPSSNASASGVEVAKSEPPPAEAIDSQPAAQPSPPAPAAPEEKMPKTASATPAIALAGLLSAAAALGLRATRRRLG
jgi:hypothetical protein